jgi:serine/threonine-protein kinase RsbW
MKNKSSFKKKTDELKLIFAFLDNSLDKITLKDNVQSELELAVEEIFMNMVRHNLETENDIEIIVDATSREVKISLKDVEAAPFDITKTDKIDLEEYINAKKSGGLGIHLIKSLMDDLNFEHKDGISTISITKYISD